MAHLAKLVVGTLLLLLASTAGKEYTGGDDLTRWVVSGGGSVRSSFGFFAFPSEYSAPLWLLCPKRFPSFIDIFKRTMSTHWRLCFSHLPSLLSRAQQMGGSPLLLAQQFQPTQAERYHCVHSHFYSIHNSREATCAEITWSRP